MTRHPATVAKPFTDPTDWRDELDDIRRMLAEDGRSGPLRDEVATLLHEVGRADRIVVALQARQLHHGMRSAVLTDSGSRTSAEIVGIRADTYGRAATIAEATQ
jgi:hypothetical protein